MYNPALEEDEVPQMDLSGKSMAGPAAGIAGGAGMGMMVGGPIGALAGAAVGGITSSMDSQSAKKKAKKEADAKLSIKGRTQASAVYDKIREGERVRLANMASLSQAAMDWANMQR
jgi:outer membrane lipoprotein SlyB